MHGAARSGMTNELLERCRLAETESAGSVLWIASNRRLALHTRRRLLDAAIHLASHSPCTFEELAGEIIRATDPAAMPLANVHRRLVIEELLEEMHARGKLPYFARVIDTRGFPAGIIEFIAELRRNGIAPDETERALTRAGSGRKELSSEIAECLSIYRAYVKRVVPQNLHDLEGRYLYARDLLVRGGRRPFEAVRIALFDGFHAFTTVQHDILTELAKSLSEIWIALLDDDESGREEMFSWARKTLTRLPSHRFVEHRSDAGNSTTPPAGLMHLKQQLFRPLRTVIRSSNGDGIHLLKAPGLLGETRMVAREIKKLLVTRIPAADILVSMRDVESYADLVREVFDEYGIPLDVEGADPVIRNPAVSTMLRALGVPSRGWSFAAVTALLRSTYFQPDWPEVQGHPEIAAKAEALLRSLGITRGRTPYLQSVDHWAEHPRRPSDDEDRERRLRRKHELAVLCRPFLRRFFRAWDVLPARGTISEHVDAARRFAMDMGFEAAGRETAVDTAALDRLWRDLIQWATLSASLHGVEQPIDARRFLQVLGALAVESGIARTPRGAGRVRVFSAPIAATLGAPYVFVMGLGERSFPQLAAPEPFLDESERQLLRKAGHEWTCFDDLLPAEMNLFYQLVTGAERQLVMSYPAVDEKGQPLLPCAFLQTVLQCFKDDRVPSAEQRMLLDGYGSETPLSLAEYRVRAAQRGMAGCEKLPADVAANLHAARYVAKMRFDRKDYGAYDGFLSNSDILAELEQVVGPECVLSSTALEEYIACPFRFFLSRVLAIEPLDEPTDEIEVSKRGQAVHAAMAGLHRKLHAVGNHVPTEKLDADLRVELQRAIDGFVNSNNPAAEVLWRLEGQRLHKWADRYRTQWERFTKPWVDLKLVPRPEYFEKGFGMPPRRDEPATEPLVIESDGVKVRIRGRIDRVDVVETDDGSGFWVIDYKTGSSKNLPAKSVQELLHVQLSIYALAVEKLLSNGPTRPLGLVHWFLGEDGVRVALPGQSSTAWFNDAESWAKFRRRLEQWIVELVSNMRAGAFSLKPRSDDCTRTCQFGQICRITQARRLEKSWQLPIPPDEA